MSTETEVLRLTEHQLKDAGKVLARALYDDPLFQYQYSGAPKQDGLERSFTVAARFGRMYGDQVYTTAVRVEGVAIWLPPGSYPMGFVPMARAGLISALLLAPLRGRLKPLARYMRCMGHLEQLHKRNAPARHWYLWLLGVDPPRQGQGIGSTLMRPGLAGADAEGLACYLESTNEKNISLYRRHGFEVVVEGDLPKGGPRFWTMMRPPRG